jgi:hypothetical protein
MEKEPGIKGSRGEEKKVVKEAEVRVKGRIGEEKNGEEAGVK